MSGAMNWLKHRWATHVEHVKLRRWQSVSYESNNEGMEFSTDDNELSAPGATGGAGLGKGGDQRAEFPVFRGTGMPPSGGK
jgi:hypothetical protein